jgi:hypothetical protein
MKRNELKQILKPLIKECIKECIFEEGVLSGIISEVVKGMPSSNLVEAKVVDNSKEQQRLEEQYEKKRQERIKKLNETTSKTFGGINVFEGTKPIKESSHGNPLSSVSAGDAGVDISSFYNKNWKELAQGGK